MPTMIRRTHALVLAAAVPAIAVLGACEDDEKATPQVVFAGTIEGGAECQDSGNLFTIGDFGNLALQPPQPSRPIKDGEAYQQGGVAVDCSVTPAGANEFNVVASVVLSGATGGTFRVDGKFRTEGEQTGIHAIFAVRRSGNTYEEVDRQCTVRYTTQFQGVASGRVWGEITCLKAENTNAQRVCKVTAQFRFENCAQ
jgi:hypothetical protein